jgi:NDP-sugar pyrophosphorylase family protein
LVVAGYWLLVDLAGHHRQPATSNQQPSEAMKGVILAAGYGTRLRPLTHTLPKPLVPLCNRPLIGWAIESYLAGGVDDLIVNLHHLPAQLERVLGEQYAHRARFFFSFEEEILGTGGALRRVRALLERERDFFLVNGDTVQFPRLEELADARRRNDALAALTLRHPPEGDRFTPVWHDRGLLTGFREGRGESLMFAGSHCISSRVFPFLPDREVSGIVGDVYEPLLREGTETLAAIVDDGLWFDIGTPQRYITASRTFLEATVRGAVAPAEGSRIRGDSLVHDTAVAADSMSRSTVGARSNVRGQVDDCVIWEDCVIAEGVRLESCIVGHAVALSGVLDLKNALICRDDPAIPQDPAYERRDGLVIVRI